MSSCCFWIPASFGFVFNESNDKAVLDNNHATISWTSKKGIQTTTLFFDVFGSSESDDYEGED